LSSHRAIIVGHQGQDGRLLNLLLRRRGYDIVGVGRAGLDKWGDVPDLAPCFLDQPQSILDTVRSFQPHEIYYVAAHHASSQTQATVVDLHRDYQTGVTVNVCGLLHFLEAMRLHAPASRLFYASSSLIFGNDPRQTPQNETTPVAPEEPYGFLKCLAGEACKDYRRRHGEYASVGILFNHESHLRAPQFLSTKLVRAAVAASLGATEPLVVGNLDATVDWGYAPDYVDAFTRILALEQPDDFVVATGAAHSVRDFAAAAFGALELDWTKHVVQDVSVLARSRSGRVGDPSKLQRMTGWRPSLTFKDMVAALVKQAAAAPVATVP
jgi:GDPmannose 4,6-dehydratase